MGFRCLFHVHTRHSFDSLLSPRTVLARAREARADVLVVTDHESMRGSEDARQIAGPNPRFVIRAGEYKTEKGDLIGMFLTEEIAFRKASEVIREIRRQGGLVVLPHPFKGHKLDDELVSQMDLIEIYNARCTDAQNHSAKTLADHARKPAIGGCDAHCAAEIGAAMNEFSCDLPATEDALRAALLTASREIRVRNVSRVYQPYSQMIKACKTRNPLLFAYQAKHLATIFAKEVFTR
jgi:predicted metal-dependent phosphoesterase TrpH